MANPNREAKKDLGAASSSSTLKGGVFCTMQTALTAANNSNGLWFLGKGRKASI